MTTYLEDALVRLTLMEKDVVSFSDAVPVAFYTQESPNYWTNAIVGFTIQDDSQDIQIVTYNIKATLVLATNTEGFENEGLMKPHTLIPTVLLYFAQRRQMKRTVADGGVVNLYPTGLNITGGDVNEGAQESGIGQGMVVADFNFELPLWQETSQVIY